MFVYLIKAGTADVSVVIRIIDSTDGTPETAVVFNTSGIDLEYRREGAASTDITEVTLAALTTAHTDGGFLHIGNGYYRLDLPDAACTTGSGGVLVHGTVTGMVVIGCYVQLVAYDPFDTVRLGLTALPNAAAAASGGLHVLGANSPAVSYTGGMTISNASGSALNLTSSGGGGAGLAATGNGSGAGIAAVAGATGVGLYAAGGATSGSAIKAVGTAGNAVGLELVGQGSAAGLKTTGGATGNGATFAGGATSGHGLQATTVSSNEIDADITGTLSTLSASALGAVADAVLDEALSGHVTSGSFGAAVAPTDQGTAQAGGANSITLRSGASAENDYYNKQLLKIIAGTGAGQSEYISDYVGATKVATMAASWITQPDITSVYVTAPGGTIPGASAPTAGEVADAVWDEARSGHTSAGSFGEYFASVFRSGTAQAGTTSSITLDSGASATNNAYRLNVISIIGGTGAGQSRQCTGYTGASKVATVDVAWTTAPDNTSVFMITPLGVDAATLAAIADAVWDEARTGHATAGTFGEYVFADATRLSGDATAADNAESFFDGTGYAGTNNIIPTVTAVTTVNGLAENSVTASALAADAITEIQSGLAMSAELSTVSTNVDAILADTGTDGVVVAAASKTGYALSNAGVDALYTRQLTESYAADGAAPTVAQALMLIQQRMTEFGINSTTLTIKKLDGSTTAATLTLNDGSAPTAVTRAS